MLILAFLGFYLTTRNYRPFAPPAANNLVESVEQTKYLHLLNQPFVVIGIIHSPDFSFISNIYKQYDNIKQDYWFFYIRDKDLVPISLYLQTNYTPQNYPYNDLAIHLYSTATIHNLNREVRNYLPALFDFTSFPKSSFPLQGEQSHLLFVGHLIAPTTSYLIYHITNSPFRHNGQFFILFDGFLYELQHQFLYDRHKYSVFGKQMTFLREFSDSHVTAGYSG